MPRRTPREHYDDDSNDSEDRDRLPRRSRHDSDSEDDMDYRPRKPNAPVDELDSLRIRERPPPKYLREDFSSRRNSRRSSPRRTPKDIEDVPAEKGEWSANAGGYASDEEEESIGGDRRRRREPIRPLESDYERRGSYSRRRDRAEVDFDYGERDNFNNSDFRSPSPRRHYPYEEDEDETRTRKHRREKRGRTHRREDPYEDGFEIREHRKPPPRFLEPQAESSSHNEWDRPSPELHRDDDEEIRIREGTIGRRGRHHRRDDSDDEEFETRRHRRSPPRFIEPSDEPWGRNERHRSPSRPRHYSDDEDEEIRMRKDTRGRRGRKLRMEDRDDDEFETRKHSRSPLRFIEPRGDPLPQDEWGRPPPRSPYPNDHEEIRILKDAKRRGKARIGDDRDEDEFLAYKHRRSSPPKYPEPRDDPWGQNEWDRSPGPRHHPSDDEDELRMREGARRRRARSPRKDNRGDDEFLIRKHRSPPRFAGPRDGRWEPVEWDRGRDHDYELSEPPRAPSPGLRLPKHSLDGLKRRHQRRRRHSNEDFQHKWQDRRSSSPPAPLPSDEHDDWREREDIRTSRRRPRSLDRAEDTSISEWDGTRPSKGIRGEPEEDMYSRRGSRRPPSDESVDDWAIVHAPPRPKKPIMDEQDDPREPRRPRRSRERGPRLAPGDGPSDYETDRSGHVGRRYGGVKDRRKRLWTEITKDLVLREAIERAGYEYEETEFFYYIFDYLQYDEVSALVDLSDDIRQARRRRIHEIHRERNSPPPPPVAGERRSSQLLLDRGPSSRRRPRERPRERELVHEDSRRRRPPPSADF